MKRLLNLIGDRISLNRNETLIVFFLIIIGLITLIPLFSTGITTYDDSAQQLLALDHSRSFFSIANSFAHGQGRFYFIYSTYLILIPYIVKSWIFIKGFAIGSILLNFIFLSIFVGKLFMNRYAAYLTFLLSCILLQNSWEHNLLNSYPLVFTFGISALLLSFILFLDYLNNKSKKLLIVSVIFYFLSLLSYETFLLYFPIYLILVFTSHNDPRSSIVSKSVRTLRILTPYILASLIYLLLYTLYRKYNPSGYDGNQLGGGSLQGFLKTVWVFGKTSTPFSYFLNDYYRTFINTYSLSLIGDSRNPIFIISNLNFSWLIKGLLVSYISMYLMTHIRTIKNFKRAVLLVVLSIAYIFIPTFLVALIPKYQVWAASGAAIAFTVTYFSYLSIILLFLGFLLLIGNLRTYVNKLFYYFITFLIVAMLFVISVTHDYVNNHITTSQRQASLKWDAVDNWAKSPEFSAIPDNSLIYAPTLWNYMLKPTYWQEYLKITANKRLTVTKNIDDLVHYFDLENREATPAAYLLQYSQETVDIQDYLVFAPIVKLENNQKLWSDNLTIYSRGKYKKYIGILPLADNNLIKSVVIDGVNSLVDENILYFTINKQWPGNLWSVASIRSEMIRPDLFILTHYTDIPMSNSKNIISLWSDGCYDREGTDERNWHWCSSKGKLTLDNNFNNPMKVNIKTVFTSGYSDKSRLKIQLPHDLIELSISDKPTIFNKDIILKPGINKISFESDAPRYAPEDPRDIRFGIIDFKLENVNFLSN